MGVALGRCLEDPACAGPWSRRDSDDAPLEDEEDVFTYADVYWYSLSNIPTAQRAIRANETDNAGGWRPQSRLDQPWCALPPGCSAS